MGKLAFLGSTRFWALVAFASLSGLLSVGIISPDVAQPLLTILAGFIGIRTIDRFGEKAGATDTK